MSVYLLTTRLGVVVMRTKKISGYLLHFTATVMLLTILIACCGIYSHAASADLKATGVIKVEDGAIIRSKASIWSSKVAALGQGSKVIVKRVVFTSKTKSGAKHKWYAVTTGAGAGYVRSDLVKITNYGSATGTALTKLTYRSGAGARMNYAGYIKKNRTFSIILEAKSNAGNKWYKIKLNGKYYYVYSGDMKISDMESGVDNETTGNPAADIVQSKAALAVVKKTCAWAQQIADDNRFHYGYGKAAHHNGCYFCGTQKLSGGRSKKGIVDYEYTYCCNPFVHAAFAHGGGEKTMLQVCQKGSSYWVTTYPKSPLFANLGVPDMSLLKKGDVLCWKNHVMLYMGSGKIAEAAGGDDNVKNSKKWNNSIRVTTLTASRYKKVIGAYRYIGNGK